MTYNINISPIVDGIYRFKVVLLGIDLKDGNDLKDKFYELNSTLTDEIKTQTNFYPKNMTLFGNNRENKINFIIFNPKVTEDYFYGHFLVGAKAGIIFYDSKKPNSKLKELIFEFLKFTRNNISVPVIFTVDINMNPNRSFEIPKNTFCHHVKLLDIKSTDFNNFETVNDSDRVFDLLASYLILNNPLKKEVDTADFDFLNKVVNLSLKGFMLENDHPIDLEFLKECKNLESLDLSGVKMDSSQLDIIRGLKLNQLILRGTRFEKIKDFTLDFLLGNKDLKILDLSGLLLNKIDLVPLSTCSNLKELIMCSNELSEIDFTPIADLENLETLDLCFNNLNINKISIPEKIKQLNGFRISDATDFLNIINLKTHCFCHWCN